MKSFSRSSPTLGCLTLLSFSLLTTGAPLSITTPQQLSAPLTVPISPQAAIEIVAIEQTLNAFAVAVDQRRFDLFDNIFTADVTVNLNIPRFPILHNLNDVAAYMGRTLQGYTTFHVQSTHYIRLAGPSHAYATTYNTATYLKSREAPIVKLGRWEDVLVKTASGWLISNRVLFHVGGGNSLLTLPGDNNSTDTLA